MGEQEEGFEPGNPFCLHSSPTRSAGSPPDSVPMVRNGSKQKDNRVLNHFCLIRPKWIPPLCKHHHNHQGSGLVLRAEFW